MEKIFSTNPAGLIAFASIVALWYVSGSVRGVMNATNVIYEHDETRSWKVRYPLSLALAAAILFCVVGATLAVLAAPALASHGVFQVVVAIGRWLVAVCCWGSRSRCSSAMPRSSRGRTRGSAAARCW